MRPPRAARRRPPHARGGLLTPGEQGRRALRALGWTLLGAGAAAGLLFFAAALFATLPATRPLAARALVGRLAGAVEGSVELGAVGVVAGGIELRDLRVRDPEGREVLRVGRARVFVDATRLGGRELAFAAELDGLELDAALRADDGGIAIARALAPRRGPARSPAPEPSPRGAPSAAEPEGVTWTVRMRRLAVTGARLRLPGPAREPLELGELSLDATGSVGPGDGFVELRLDGALAAPTSAPVSLRLRAIRLGERVELQRLEARLGDDRLEAVGEGNLADGSGRIAVTRLGLSRGDAGALAPAARLAGDLSGTLYAETDGKVASAALAITPASAEATGRASLAAAVALPPRPFAWGLVADVDRLDPSRLTLLAPAGSVTLRGSGGARGARFDDLVGRIDLAVEPSRLRGGTLGPVRLTAQAGGGSVQVPRLLLSAPGGSLDGRLHWREGTAVSGELRVDLEDLERSAQNLGLLLGRTLPPLAGRARGQVALAGTSDAPRIDAVLEAPWLAAEGLRAERATLSLRLDGPEVAFALAAGVPALGSDPIRLELAGRLGESRRSFDLGTLLVAWPGSAFTLLQPARVDLGGPAVDRLALGSGEQRLELMGGAREGALDARLRIVGLDLGRLPRGLLPPRLGLAGVATLDARVGGRKGAPRVEGTLGLAGGDVLGVGGLSLLGDVAWDGGARRAEADLELVRARGGAATLSLDVPLPPGPGRGAEPLQVELAARGLPLEELAWLAGSYALVSGEVEGAVRVAGTVAAPTLRAGAKLRDGTWDELEGLGAEVTAEAPGERIRVAASAGLDGGREAAFDGEARLDLARLLARPAEALAAAREGEIRAELRVLGLDLARIAGRLGLPADLAGRFAAEARLGGKGTAPRGSARVELRDGAGWGARSAGLRVEAALSHDRTGATAALQLGGHEAARLDARIDLAAERLLDRAALAAAPVQVELQLPRSELAAWGGEIVRLRGSVEGSGTLRGTPGAPRAELRVAAAGASVAGRPLGDLSAEGRYLARRSTVVADLRPPAGGTLRIEGSLEHAFGLGAAAGPPRDAPARLHAVAESLDLGFLPAALPGLVRAASGAATLDLAAEGPLGGLRPRGSVRVAEGRLAIAELGDWTGAEIDARLAEDTVELRRFDVRKGTGRFSLSGSVTGLAQAGPAELVATLRATDFGVEHAGIEYVRLDLKAEGRGQLDRHGLTLGIVLPEAEVRLPRRIPRTLQETSPRKDITVGRPPPPRARRAAPAAEAGPAPAEAAPFRTVLHAVAPRRLRVKADQPRVDVELKGDLLLAFAGGRQEATGNVQVIRGQVEPIGGRVFDLERGKASFAGGPIVAGALDVAARYEAPKAVVRATVGGTVGKPQLHLASEPPLEESQIALLLATGRTEAKVGAGGANTLAAGDAGLAAAGALAMGVFKDLLSDKLPLDSVSLDSTAVTAGKYLTDRVYVGYVRRFDAKPERGENPDEIRMEYQLAPGWQVETRYGSGQAGSASIVWTRNY